MFAVVVTFEILPDRMADFLPLMMENAQTSRSQEPGCLRFDVCTDDSRPAVVFLYELYEDEKAFAAHMASDHFKGFAKQSDPMIAAKDVHTYRLVNA